MKAKFQLGDRVRFTTRAPKLSLRKRSRVIADSRYCPQRQCRLYYLSDVGKAVYAYPFRSFHLQPAQTGQKQKYIGKKVRYRFLLTPRNGQDNLLTTKDEE